MTTRLLKSSENINGLPTGFQEVEYIESTGTQYIDLDVGVKANTVFKAIFSVASTATGRSYFGARNSSNERFQIVNSIGIGAGYYLASSVYPIANQKYEIEMHASGEMYLDGVKRNATTGTFSQVSFERNLWLFATNYYDSSVGAGASTFWKVQIFEGDVLVRDLIPALNPAGRPCMYDLVGKKAYYNIGTGEFSYGRKIIPVEYLESSGQGQYIKTGITANFNTKAETLFSYSESSGSPAVLGGRTSSTSGAFCIWGKSNAGYVCCNFSNTGVFNSSVTASTNTKYTAILDSSGYTVNGSKTAITTTTTFTSPELYMFDVQGANTSTSGTSNRKLVGRIYYAKLWDNGTLVRDYIPCIDENNVPYMFDKVTHTCYLNAGTGTFNYGKKLYSSKVRLYKDSEANKLPIGFKRVEYLESSGTQFILTGFTPTVNTDFELELSSTKTSTNWAIGCPTWVGVHYKGADGQIGVTNSSTSDFQQYVNYARDNTRITMKLQGNTVYANDTSFGTITRRAGTLDFALFGYRDANRGATLLFTGSIYKCKIWDNNTLVCNFIPALDTTNTPCMYDTVTQTAFYNQGTGEFTYGSIIPNKVRLPQSTEIRFPKGYTEVEYLESTGEQYIDTGYKPVPATTKFEFYFSPTNISGNYFPFGARPNTSIGGETCTTYFSTGNIRQDWAGLNTYFPKINVDDKVLYSAYNNTVSLNDNSITGTVVRSTDRLDYNFLLFTVNTGGTADSRRYVGRVYYSKLWENDKLIHYFIPALDPNGRPCLWDTVTKKPYYNQGTGEFTYGRSIQQVSYLESSGTQYINTNILPTQLTKAKIEMQFTAVNYKQSVLGSNNGASGDAGWNNLFGTNENSSTAKPTYFWCQWGASFDGPVTKDTNKHTHTFERNGDTSWTYSVDSSSITITSGIATQTTPKVLYLFACNNNGTLYRQAKAKVYQCQIWNNGTLVRDYVPAIDSNNVGFMFDRVTHTIFDNAGTGSFTYGSPVPNKIRD